jgi:hypothetical protein
MAEKNDQGHWIDGKGDTVPPKYVKKYDKRRDSMVMKLFRQAKLASKRLADLKKLAFDDIEKFLRDAENMYGMTVRTAGGNKILTDFSNVLKIEVKVAKVIDFDERLQMAKAIIDDCIKRWSEGSNDKIRMIVDRAFQVDKKGQVDKDRILDLRGLAIKDKEWKKAMDLINESIRIVGKRTYIRFWERNERGNWVTVPLDIAGC